MKRPLQLTRAQIAHLAKHLSEHLQEEHDSAPASTAAYIANGNGVTEQDIRAALRTWNEASHG